MANVPYEIIGECFKDHSIVPFLGSAASFVGASPEAALPSGADFAALLARKGVYPGAEQDPLTKIAQFIEEGPGDRDFLLKTVKKIFHEDILTKGNYETAFTRFIKSIQSSYRPKLLITTNYDSTLEVAFDDVEVPYVVITQIANGTKSGRFLCYANLGSGFDEASIQTYDQVNSFLQEQEEAKPGQIIIYKMHGTAKMVVENQNEEGSKYVDSIILTENDYINFLAEDRLKKIPVMILEKMRIARLLFLGYALEDWNFRILLRRINKIQRQKNKDEMRHWACLLSADDVEVGFWNKRGVNIYNCSLDEFLPNLKQLLVK